MIYTLSIVIGFIIGYAVALKYAIIKRDKDDIQDGVTSALDAIKDTIKKPRARVLSPYKDKQAKDLLKGLEDE